MTQLASTAALASAAQPLAPANSTPVLAEAARLLLPNLEQGRRIDAPALRAAMDTAFGGSDTDGAWDWKTAYDACEGAAVLFLRKYGKALLRKAGSPAAALPPAPACSPFSPRSPEAPSASTNSPRHAAISCLLSFRLYPSRASTRPRSMIIWTPLSCPASC